MRPYEASLTVPTWRSWRLCRCDRPDQAPQRRQRPIRNGDPRVAVSFAESISLSSTGSADLRLPPTAFGSGFDLLALRARRKEESRRGQVRPQEVERRKGRNLQEFNYPHFHSRPCSLWIEVSGV